MEEMMLPQSTMASTEQISAALLIADSMKSTLREAYKVLKSRSPPISSFNLQWQDVDAHFTSIHNSISLRLKELETLETQLADSQRGSLSNPKTDALRESGSQIETLCLNMDADGLRLFLVCENQVRNRFCSEVGEALRLAPDAPKLVLGAVERFRDEEGSAHMSRSRKRCVLLLKEMVRVSPQVKDEVRVEAVRVAREWKEELLKGVLNPPEVFWFLHFVRAFGLRNAFGDDEVFNLFLMVIKRKKAVEMCSALGLIDKVQDYIESLIKDKQRFEAIELIYAYGLVGAFNPVFLLKEHIKYTRKLAKALQKKKNNSFDAQNEGDNIKLAGLRAVRECVLHYKLETEYPLHKLKNKIKFLKSNVAERRITGAKNRN